MYCILLNILFFFEIRVKNMLKTTERNTKVERKSKRKTIKYYVKYIKYVIMLNNNNYY